jgi:hypothetical protein
MASEQDVQTEIAALNEQFKGVTVFKYTMDRTEPITFEVYAKPRGIHGVPGALMSLHGKYDNITVTF